MSSVNPKNSLVGSNVLQCANKSSISSKFLPYNKDIVPVHGASSKIMACQKELRQPLNKKLHWARDNSDCELSSELDEKLNINKYEFKIINTNTELHHGSIENKNCMKEKVSCEVMKCDEIKKRVASKCNIPESALQPSQNTTNSPSSSQNSISNNFISSYKMPIDKNSILKYKENTSHINDTLCNGYSVSEATSSNSIAVSDLSAISDKSINSTASSSYTSSRCISSNSQSQGQCDSNSSFGSDSNKSPISPSIAPPCSDLEIIYVNYVNENQMSSIMKLIQKDLSEPYSIYTYRYFIHNWPKLCFLAIHKSEVVGAIVCKLDMHKKTTVRGYIAMLAVGEKYRKKKIGSNLVLRAIRAMATDDADEVVLETEITNQPALKLYENLGFVRDKRLFRYYLNGVDALRLKLWLR